MKLLKIRESEGKPFSVTSIRSDAKMKFYTGIQKIAIFDALFSLTKPQNRNDQKGHTHWHPLLQVHSIFSGPTLSVHTILVFNWQRKEATGPICDDTIATQGLEDTTFVANMWNHQGCDLR